MKSIKEILLKGVVDDDFEGLQQQFAEKGVNIDTVGLSKALNAFGTGVSRRANADTVKEVKKHIKNHFEHGEDFASLSVTLINGEEKEELRGIMDKFYLEPNPDSVAAVAYAFKDYYMTVKDIEEFVSGVVSSTAERMFDEAGGNGTFFSTVDPDEAAMFRLESEAKRIIKREDIN